MRRLGVLSFRLLLALLLAATDLHLYAATLPQFTVAPDGSGQFRTMQEALDAAPPTGAVLHIRPGIYREKLHIDKNGIQLRGEGQRPEDVVLVWGDSAAMAGGTGKSGSLSVSGDNFVAVNLTIQNDWEKTHART